MGPVAFKEAAQVAIRDDAEEGVVRGEDGGHAKFLAGHLIDDLSHGSVGGDLGEGLAGVHDVAYAGKTTAKVSSGVEVGEVFGASATAGADVERECVAKRKHDGGGGGGGEVEGAGFDGDAGVEGDETGLGEAGGRGSAKGDERGAEAVKDGEKVKDLGGFSAGGEGQKDVARGDHADVSVDGLGRVEEVGWGSGRAKGGGHFAGDEAGFAYAGEDDAVDGDGG